MTGHRPPGLRWSDLGHAAFSGPLRELAHACDEAFRGMAARWSADAEDHAAVVAAADLAPIGYLRSFPHLATFATALDPEGDNLSAFAADPSDARTGAVRLTGLAATTGVLTPAACYHVYIQHRGEEFTGPRYITTQNTCFRRESHYQPLRRQHSFRMREIVCLGTREEVTAFLDENRRLTTRLLTALGLPDDWVAATDPFFDPAHHPGYLAQKLQPTKHEARYGDLAVASVNLHEDHFGSAYHMRRDGRAVSSGCIAFGIERWLFALVDRWGTEHTGWPDPRDALAEVLA
ncbi:aminoacyl--tRNA ligase-related protein [Mangrovihabitans endophyticus]|uniref:Aminoacyl-tRNA synthetase class II (G/ P/ S/T) domain-containing protein n=1 Tax=Mangrovihabitans endophyticus TaxID=1751298 RepID=A0A8J3BW78_9ACTN|nr:aminoacyl--tRNA ligase-related protein [Mangrovihabitans endophyticus]GGK74805.1 hypothetical protein GCM10012284_05920 [Mangrovihabitans endophyticus]